VALTDFMYFKYGGHTHPAGEVNLVNMEAIGLYTDRNERWATQYRMHITGELCYTGQSNLRPKIEELIAAYTDNDQDATLFESDGTASPHRLINADSITGVKVVHRSWPSDGPDEYATVRTFHIVLQATYLDADSGILSFEENVRIFQKAGEQEYRWRIGNTYTPVANPGGNRPFVINTPALIRQTIRPDQWQYVIQEGTLVGLQSYLIDQIPPPLFSEERERGHRRIVSYGAPDWAGRGFIRFPLSWRYEFFLPSEEVVNGPTLYQGTLTIDP
jgi:hypothetical protein